MAVLITCHHISKLLTIKFVIFLVACLLNREHCCRSVVKWLGNTVTFDWWDDLWITEGMGVYFQYLAARSVQPTWDTVSTGKEFAVHHAVVYSDQF